MNMNIKSVIRIVTYHFKFLHLYMFEIEVATCYGFGIGIYYTNEDIEGMEKVADNLRNTIQIAFFFVIININYYTDA